jgi:hypothetical protein
VCTARVGQCPGISGTDLVLGDPAGPFLVSVHGIRADAHGQPGTRDLRGSTVACAHLLARIDRWHHS